MKTKSILILALSFGLYLTSCNNSNKNSTNNTSNTDTTTQANSVSKQTKAIDKNDSTFMTEVASVNMMEIKAGQIALQRGKSQQVKDFGQRMITDHTKIGEGLKTLAGQKNVVLPASISSGDQSDIDKLNKVDARDFDKTYINMMVDGHKGAVAKFQGEINNSQDADVKAWVQNTLPILQHHLEMAKADKDIIDKQ